MLGSPKIWMMLLGVMVIMAGFRFGVLKHSNKLAAAGSITTVLQTKLEMTRIKSAMETAYQDTQTRIPEGDFSAWVGSNFDGFGTRTPGEDYFGFPYKYEHTDEGFEITSPGPDGLLGSEDDLHTEALLTH